MRQVAVLCCLRFSIVKNPEISANDLNHDLDVIRLWPHQWKLEFNPDTTKDTGSNHPQRMFNAKLIII